MRGTEARLTEEVRGAYWLAAACNVLAGAVIYHFTVANDKSCTDRKRARALQSLSDGLRVLRRADSYWSEG